MNRSVAVIIPTFNQTRYLYRAISSCYWQLEPGDEIIVVDDASTDGPYPKSLECFMDRVIFIRNPQNRGCSYSRNRAIERASAEWIKFLDADDLLAPYGLLAIKKAPDDVLEGTQVMTGGCHRIVNGDYADYLNGAYENIDHIKEWNPMLPSATFARRQALLEVGLFDERIDFEEDWDMWLKIHERYGPKAFRVVYQPVCYYWIEDNERQIKRRHATVEGLPVREYFRKRYGADPQP